MKGVIALVGSVGMGAAGVLTLVIGWLARGSALGCFGMLVAVLFFDASVRYKRGAERLLNPKT